MVVPCFFCPAISSCSTVLSFLEGNFYNPVCIYVYNKDMKSSPVIWVACVEFTGTPVLMGPPFPYSHRKPRKTSGKIMGINVPSARGPKKNLWINRRVKCNNQVNTWAKNSMDYVWLGWRKFMMDSETRPSIMDYTWNLFTIHHPQACIDNYITRSILDGYKLIL